jgi:hypothetical protein
LCFISRFGLQSFSFYLSMHLAQYDHIFANYTFDNKFHVNNFEDILFE